MCSVKLLTGLQLTESVSEGALACWHDISVVSDSQVSESDWLTIDLIDRSIHVTAAARHHKHLVKQIDVKLLYTSAQQNTMRSINITRRLRPIL